MDYSCCAEMVNFLKPSHILMCIANNMGNWDLLDVYAHTFRPAVLGLGQIYQANPSCPCYNLYIHTNTCTFIIIAIYCMYIYALCKCIYYKYVLSYII